MALHRHTVELLGIIQENANTGIDNWDLVQRFLHDAQLDGEPLHEAVSSLAQAVKDGDLQRKLREGRKYMFPPTAPLEEDEYWDLDALPDLT